MSCHGATALTNPWSGAERDLFADIYRSRTPMPEIARRLGRSISALSIEASRLGIRHRTVERRLCIPGQHLFWSTHKFNRICRCCAVDNFLEVA